MSWFIALSVLCFHTFVGISCHALPAQVWLTVSSLATPQFQRNFQLHWRCQNTTSTDWVGLFTRDPVDSNGAIRALRVDSSKGYYETDVQFPYRNFPTGKLTENCLGYYVGFFRNGQVIAKNCLKTNPFWMENLLKVIGHKPLTDIVIPGTHDAGAYEKYGPHSENIFKKYQMCQDESIYNQLVYGIRYFDMRLGYHDVYDNDEKYWIVHGLLRTENTLKAVTQQVRDFLLAAPKEIVIFDFHKFENGFYNEKNQTIVKQRYQEFFRIITSYLKEFMIPFSLGYRVSINDLVKMNKRVLVGFASKPMDVLDSDLLWPEVHHQWGDKDDVDELEKYFDRTLCVANRFILKTVQAELTPKSSKIWTNQYGGLRKMAHQVNLRMADWFQDRWWNCVNIVSPDFFLGSNIVEIAIHNNIRLNKTRNNWVF